MKEKIVNLKEKILEIVQKIGKGIALGLKKTKDLVTPFILKNKKTIIFAIIAMLILTAIITFIFIISKEKRGNTSGNLNNLGIVLKHKGWVYYIGYNDGVNDGVYRIKGDKKEKFIADYALYLNKSGNYIYYLDVKEEDIVRIKANGKNKETIVENVDIEKITIVDDWIYYFEDTKLCRIKTNGKDKQIILEKSIENYEINKKWIYYSYKNDGKYVIAKKKITEDEIIKINQDAGENFFIVGKNIYYIYINNINDEYKYELYRMNLNGKNIEKTIDLPKDIFVSSINFDKDEIYYLKQSEATNLAMFKMSLDGKEIELANINGYATYINIIDNWIYYPDVSDYNYDLSEYNPDINDEENDVMFRMKTNGEERENLCK